jgi:TatD DNase family protein
MTAAGSRALELVDTHAHLVDRRFAGDLGAVIERARVAGVVQIIAIGTDAADSAAVVELAQRASPENVIFAAVGIHPNETAAATLEDWPRVVAMANDRAVVAIGETGLDRHWKTTPFEDQRSMFIRHIELGRALAKPVVIHCRNAEADVIQTLSDCGPPIHGVLHSFSGGVADAERMLELGLYLSFAGMITFANKSLETLREAARVVPLDRILVETDSPYLAPTPFRGERNEPAHVVHTLDSIARARGIDLVELAVATTRNARALFGLPDPPRLAEA